MDCSKGSLFQTDMSNIIKWQKGNKNGLGGMTSKRSGAMTSTRVALRKGGLAKEWPSAGSCVRVD